jgi:hypothetical protein
LQIDIDYLICIPVYKVSERTHKCMESIKDKNVLLIDNSGTKECEVFEQYGFQIEYQTENIGIPRSWNIGLKKGHDWTFIVSSSMLFNKPFSHIIDMLGDYKGLMFRTTHAWHCNGINKKLVDQVGYFDENFYPGYFEDCDWDHRCGILRINEYGNIPIDAICQIDGGASKDGLKLNIDGVHDYFKEKWGGTKTREGWGEYQHPFNDPSKPLDYWETNSIETLKKRYLIK